jgi:glycosyltransferase involved in cell wall biosynthesis
VLIGEVFCDVSRLRDLPNVHLLGRREHEALPSYCKAFDAAIIPYDMRQARMESVNPVKTKELLAAGVPIVAADVPELRGYGADVVIVRGQEDWCGALERQAARDDRQAVSARVAGEDWAVKVAGLRRVVDALGVNGGTTDEHR